MPSSFRTLVATFCALLASAEVAGAQRAEESLQAKVISYGSASAFAVLDDREKLRRVKLTGVDAPERRQPFGLQAQQLASDYLGGGAVTITVDSVDQEQRIYGRIAVDGRDLGLLLLEAGLAWCDPADHAILPSGMRSAYRQACGQARAQHRGLWSNAHPIPPWEYRKVPQFESLEKHADTARHCREIGWNTVQCDEGRRYRSVGNQVFGSDGTLYTRRGNSFRSSDGERYHKQGKSVYGTDGSVCRTRDRRIDCFR
jgi:endonuclease YncB( thermonuclease family)